MPGRVAFPALVLVATCGSVAPALAETATRTLAADADNTLWEDPAGASSDGQGCFITIGRSGSTGDFGRRRGLLRFGSLADSIPAEATIRRVTLRLDVADVSRMPVRRTISLHRVTRPWGEVSTGTGCTDARPPIDASAGDATWLHAFHPGPCPDRCWQAPGGDFDGAASGSVDVLSTGPLVLSSRASPDDPMVADVRSWRDQRAGNFGWILIGNETDVGTVARVGSRETEEVVKRPQLVVEYEIGGSAEQPRACCFEDQPCDVLVPSECIAAGGHPGDSSGCSPDPCPRPCCFGLLCEEITPDECRAQGGAPGPGLGCATSACALEPFVDPLPIIPAAVPESGTRYRMPMTQFKHKFHRDLDSTVVWGYQGMVPGPTIEASRDVPVTVEWINDLRNTQGDLRTRHILPVDPCLHGAHMIGAPPTVVHLHGSHITPNYDGNPDSTFLPGEGREYVYPNHQLPATLWYHDHALGITRLNVMMGLAGFYLIRDGSEPGLGLPPREYEIPLLIQDRSFRSNGSIQYPETWQPEFMGDYPVVNGKVSPYLSVRAGVYRFRLLNASNFRVFRFELSNGAPFHLIGTEGSFLAAPVAVAALGLTPGERADVLVDFSGASPGEEIILRNSAEPDHPLPDIMKFVVGAGPGHTSLPQRLVPLEPFSEAEADSTRDFVIRQGPETDACGRFRFLFNHLGFDEVRDYPGLGSTEIWTFKNCTPFVHPVHVHLVMFRVLDRQSFSGPCDGPSAPGPRIPPDSSEWGWKDTAPVAPNQILRILVPFRDYTGIYPFHCHMLEHEDNELMRQFVVVDRPVNHAPEVSAASPSAGVLWPRDGRMAPVWITGVTDPDGDPVQITITAVTQDEPLSGKREREEDDDRAFEPRDETGAADETVDGPGAAASDGADGGPGAASETRDEPDAAGGVAGEGGDAGGFRARMPRVPDGGCQDATIGGNGLVYLRRESLHRSGRVYAISFIATDGRGASSSGVVRVCVPRHRRGRACREDDVIVSSLGPCKRGRDRRAARESIALTVGTPHASATGTVIEYDLPAESDVLLVVYDVAGRRVATLESSRREAGRHQATWNSAAVPAGVYFARLRAGGTQATKTILVAR